MSLSKPTQTLNGKHDHDDKIPFPPLVLPAPAVALNDLSEGEYLFVERMVILERAKTAALLDRETGDSLLDYLASAWGDSSLTEAMAGVPRDPIRSEAVTELLGRMIEAEQESLLTSTGLDRLDKPLPDPTPVPPAEPTEFE